MPNSLFFILYSLFLFIPGAAVGSFLNVLIDRLPQEESINGRSHCDHCNHQLAWFDLIPIVSFLWLKGKCRYCGKKLSFQYPLVEILTGGLFVLIPLVIPTEGRNPIMVSSTLKGSLVVLTISELLEMTIIFGLFSSLVVIFFADLKYRIIPDSMQVAFFIFAFLLKIFSPSFLVSQFPNFLVTSLPAYLVTLLNGFLAGFLVTLPILFLFLITRGRGMGFGDVKLSFTIGFLLGIPAGFLALYFGFVIGGILGGTLVLLKKKTLKSKIAFGPFLVIGMLIMLLYGEKVLELVKTIYQL